MVEKSICAVTSCRMLPMCSGGLGAAAADTDIRESTVEGMAPSDEEEAGVSTLLIRGTTL